MTSLWTLSSEFHSYDAIIDESACRNGEVTTLVVVGMYGGDVWWGWQG